MVKQDSALRAGIYIPLASSAQAVYVPHWIVCWGPGHCHCHGQDTVTGNNSEHQERSGQNGFYEGGWGEGEQDTVMPWGQTIHCIAVN